MKSYAKSYGLAAIIYLAVFAIYNLLIFLIFRDLNNVFWISYGFLTISVLANIAVVLLSTKKADVEAAFFGIPLISFSIFHVIAELFASLIFMIFKNHVSVQLTITIQIVLFLVFVIFAALAIMAKDAVQTTKDRVKENVSIIKGLASDIKFLESECTDNELKAQLHKVGEAMLYSDPMTTESVAQLDEMIKGKVAELTYACQTNNKNDAIEACLKLQSFIKQRNSKIAISK